MIEYNLQGERTSGKQINYKVTDLKIAKFEFDCLTGVSNYVVLYECSNAGLKQIDLYYK